MPAPKSRKVQEMASEYRFDYKKAKPNRFAKRAKDEPVTVLLGGDVRKVFETAAKKASKPARKKRSKY